MPKSCPLRIGISACFFHADPLRAVFKGKTLIYLEQSLLNWVSSQGALVYLIPPVGPAGGPSTESYVNELDGLVLQGGSDVAPGSYGETPLKPEWAGDAIRDAYEIDLVRRFIHQRKPVLGICRGAQLLNVAFSGTLHQDIATQLPSALNHRNWDIYDQNFHPIQPEPESWLEKWIGPQPAQVNTVHHQAIKKLGQELRVEARCPNDGIIEAIRGTGNSFVYAMQWHPEFQDPADGALLDGRPILREFLKNAEERK